VHNDLDKSGISNTACVVAGRAQGRRDWCAIDIERSLKETVINLDDEQTGSMVDQYAHISSCFMVSYAEVKGKYGNPSVRHGRVEEGAIDGNCAPLVSIKFT